jgi:predicted RNA binding protein YcfA (HicA-like mRNA interferase family)
MAGGLPAVSGVYLMKLLERDGWKFLRESTHGKAYGKMFPDGPRVTTIPNRTDSLPTGTLKAILGPRQTNYGRHGFLKLLGK